MYELGDTQMILYLMKTNSNNIFIAIGIIIYTKTRRRYLAVVIDVFDAAIEPFAVWSGLPVIVGGVEVLHVPPADLQR